jgi:hypothetical protein
VQRRRQTAVAPSHCGQASLLAGYHAGPAWSLFSGGAAQETTQHPSAEFWGEEFCSSGGRKRFLEKDRIARSGPLNLSFLLESRDAVPPSCEHCGAGWAAPPRPSQRQAECECGFAQRVRMAGRYAHPHCWTCAASVRAALFAGMVFSARRARPAHRRGSRTPARLRPGTQTGDAPTVKALSGPDACGRAPSRRRWSFGPGARASSSSAPPQGRKTGSRAPAQRALLRAWGCRCSPLATTGETDRALLLPGAERRGAAQA